MTTRPCLCEQLEPRQLLSAATLTNGVLRVEGSRRADQIGISSAEVGKDARAGVEVTVNGQVFHFRLKGIARVEIVGGDGDDQITTASPGRRRGVELGAPGVITLMPEGDGFPTINRYLDAPVLPTVVLAGDGRDTVYGSAADETLDGGAGDDVVYGLAGDDVLIGGAGNDSLRGNQGADTLDGGAGDDDLAGESDYLNRMPTRDARDEIDYLDVLTGGAGADTFYTHDGKDQIKDAARRDRRVDPLIAY